MTRDRKLHLLAAFSLAAIASALAFKFVDWPPNRDITTYATIASELRLGAKLYTDVWDIKPPAIFATYMLTQSFVAAKPIQLLLLDLVPTLIVLAALISSAGAAGFPRSAGLWSGALWVTLSGNLLLQMHEPNTEIFINAATAVAFLMMLRLRSPRLGTAFVIGLLFAAACAYKTVAIAAAAAVGVAHLLAPFPGSSFTRRARQVGIMALAGALGLTCVTAYFAVTGRFDVFREVILEAGAAYAGNVAVNVMDGLLLAPLADVGLPFRGVVALVPWLTVATIATIDRAHRREWCLLGAYAFGSIVAVALPGQFYAHYFQLLLPPLCLGVGWLITAAASLPLRSARRFAHAFALLLLGTLAWRELATYRLPAEQAVAGSYQELYLRTEQLAQRLSSALGPDTVLYQWGEESGLYWHSGKRPPGSVLTFPMLGGPQAERLTEQTLAALASRPPDVVVAVNYLLARGAGHPVLEWVRAHYVAVSPADPDERRYFTLFIPADATPVETARLVGSAPDA